MKRVILCNYGQGPERDFGYGKSWHIPNYQLFKRAYHLLDFQKTWIFHEHQSVIVWSQVYFKIRLFEMSMFWLNWLRRWENIYLNGSVPDNDHKFSSLRQFANHSLFHVSKIFNFQNAMHKRWKHKSIHFIHVRTKFFFKKYT